MIMKLFIIVHIQKTLIESQSGNMGSVGPSKQSVAFQWPPAYGNISVLVSNIIHVDFHPSQ